MKHILKNNIIKFFIGLALLIVCFLYIQRYPAEKIAIFSGFQVMIQRAEIFMNKIFNKNNSDALQSKFDYEKAYEELVRIVEANGCKDVRLPDEIREQLQALKDEPMLTLPDSLPSYIRKANEFRTRVAQQCKKN